ncbi:MULTISPECIES: AI-2E family transporter [Vibrio]|uniref:AI-2E family transporter n=1 Tax=Vibrio TaxID=662 RepID=UPI0005F0C599|nr:MULTISPECIES: AI-2E family transporter [Vibrio]USD52530.1 AI-2E family transporter [Vibrio sp. SCSIO 43153]
MSNSNENLEKVLAKALTTSLIRFSVTTLIVIVCWWAFLPFLPILLWALVLAIALYPIKLLIERKFSLSSSRSATLIAIVGVLILGTPTAMVGNSFASKTLGALESYRDGTLVVSKPADSVKSWPLVGEKVHAVWYEAADDLPTFIEKRQPQIKTFFSGFVDSATGAAKSMFMLIGAIIIAGIMLAWAQPAAKSIRKIFISFTDEVRGPELHELTTATIRQVAVGIIGIAFLTAMAFGAVVALSGVPVAALFTLIALVFAIVQLPVTIIALVAVGLLWAGDSGTVHNVIFTILLIAASLIDNFLKPLILGRGLDVPMPIVLIGAVGGMMSGGILGMFIGAAFLAAGYQVFMKWVDTETQDVAEVIENTSVREEKKEAAEPKN